MSVSTRRHPGWVEIVLDRPQRRNAIEGSLALALAEAVESVNAEPDVAAVLLRGAGGAFCSGLDIDEFRADPPPPWLEEFKPLWRRVHKALFDSPHVLVCGLERFAINGGAALALACDLLIAGRTAFLQVGEIRIGMAAPYNLAWLRLRHSESTTSRLSLLGDRIDAEELLRLGVATEISDDSDVLPRARELTAEVGGFPEHSAARMKRAVRRSTTDLDADTWFDAAFAVLEGSPRSAAPTRID